MKKILFEDALILRAAKVARFFVHLLPPGVSFFIGRCIGSVLFGFTQRRKIAIRNLRAAFASQMSRLERRRIALRSIRNLAVSVVELLRIPDMDADYIQKHIRIQGDERFKPYLKEGKGIIFLAAHFGNWELLNVAGALLGYPLLALARVQKHPRSDEFLNSLRASKGSQVIRKGMPVREILRSLSRGGIVGILSDQDGGRQGTFVRFFNRWSSSPSGVATFALRTGAPIFPVFMFRENGVCHRVEVEGPLEIPDPCLGPEEREEMILQQFAGILEAKIRKAPDQWLWAHRRWKSTPDRFVLILSDGKAGHRNQALAALAAFREARRAEGVSDECTHSRMIKIKFKSHFLKNLLTVVCFVTQGRIPFKHGWLRMVLEKECYDAVLKTYADVVISAGSSLLAVNLLVKDENQAKSLVLMKPYFSARRFEAVIVSRHDGLGPAENVFVTHVTPSPLSENDLKAKAEDLRKELGPLSDKPRIGLLIGGDTEKIQFDRNRFQQILEGIHRFSLESRSLLFATSSRRTPAWADALLKEKFKDRSQCPLLVIANEANRSEVVGGILGLCDLLVVSGESLSMVSEAVSSGKPVVVFMPCPRGSLKPKYRRFLESLVKESRVVPAEPHNIHEVIKEQIVQTNGIPKNILSKDREVIHAAVRRVI